MTLEEMREACAKVAWKNEAAQSTVDAIRAVPIPAASAAEKYEAERRGVEAAVEAIASRLDHEAAEASRYVGTDNGQTAETWREAAAVVRSFPKLPSVAAVMAETIENHTRRAIENKAAVARLVDSVAAPGYDGQYAAAVIGDDLRRRFATATAPIDDEPPVIRERDEARRALENELANGPTVEEWRRAVRERDEARAERNRAWNAVGRIEDALGYSGNRPIEETVRDVRQVVSQRDAFLTERNEARARVAEVEAELTRRLDEAVAERNEAVLRAAEVERERDAARAVATTWLDACAVLAKRGGA